MIKTLYNLAILQGHKDNISSCGVCLADFKRMWIKKQDTYKDLHRLKNSWFIAVTSVSYPRGLRRYYYTLTIKGKDKLELPLSLREKFYLKFI